LNNNAYQIERGRKHNNAAGMDEACRFIEADFMEIPEQNASYDAAYAIESTCHAPDRTEAYAEILRVLKPGAPFAGYEWGLTDRFDPDSSEHRSIKKGIEEGDGLPDLTHVREVDRALVQAGFELLEARDLADTGDAETPWYLPLSGGELTLAGLGRTPLGRLVTHGLVLLLEQAGIAPRGATRVHSVLLRAADCLVKGGQQGIFTPLYHFHARKPAPA
jgi:sterol 24-C-methyltransferase